MHDLCKDHKILRLQAQLYKHNYALTYTLTYTQAHISNNYKKTILRLYCNNFIRVGVALDI
jgi:hypothetical protein